MRGGARDRFSGAAPDDGARSAAGADAAAAERAAGGAAVLPPPPLCPGAPAALGAAADAAPPLVVLCPVPRCVAALRLQSTCAPELLGSASAVGGGGTDAETASTPRRPSAASDMWAVGALLYEAAIGRAAVLRPEEVAVGVPAAARRPATRGGIGERLCGLLAALLARDPERRLRASEALGHPYFAGEFSFVYPLWNNIHTFTRICSL